MRPSYSYLRVSRTTTELVDDLGGVIEGEGFSAFVSRGFNENMFFYAGYSYEQADVYWLYTPPFGFDGYGLLIDKSLSFGFGVHFPVSERVDLLGSLGITSADLTGELDGVEFDYAQSDSTDVRLGMRVRPNESLELEFAWDKRDADIGELNGTGFIIGARIYTSDKVALSLISGQINDVSTLALGIEFHF